MAYVKVSTTRDGRSAVKYTLEDKRKDSPIERVLAVSALNMDERNALEEMVDTWKHFNKDDGEYVQAYRVIQSFSTDDLDYRNNGDIEKANEIGFELAQELYPDKQVLVVTQADGEGGKLHNHIVVNSVGFADGKSLRSQRTSVYTIRDKSDEIVKRHGLSVIDSQKSKVISTIAERKLRDGGKYVWKDDIRERINKAILEKSTDGIDGFMENMKQQDVDVRLRGQSVSFTFDDEDGKHRRVRGKRLGNDFEIESISDRIAVERHRDAQESLERHREVLRQEEAQRASEALLEAQRAKEKELEEKQERQRELELAHEEDELEL